MGNSMVGSLLGYNHLLQVMKSELFIVFVITAAQAVVSQRFDTSNLSNLNRNQNIVTSQLNAALSQQQQRQQSSSPPQSIISAVQPNYPSLSSLSSLQNLSPSNPNIQRDPTIINQPQIQLNSLGSSPNNPKAQPYSNVANNPIDPNPNSNNPSNPANIYFKAKFDQMKAEFGKIYSSPEEEVYRYSVFVENLKQIQLFNSRGQSYYKGVNQFTDWTHQEFVDKMLMKNPPLPPIPTPTPSKPIRTLFVTDNISTPASSPTLSYPQAQPISTTTPTSSPTLSYPQAQPISTTTPILSQTFPYPQAQPISTSISNKMVIIDWVTRHKVAKIKNQGSCASCWAFSAVGVVESNFAIQKGLTPVMLSEQQVVDCCGPSGYGCNGCQPSWVGDSLDYIAAVGLQTSLSYPYIGQVQACKTFASFKYLQKPSFTFVPAAQILTHLLKGPLSISIDASGWHQYAGGLFTDCPNDANVQINHFVVMVGADKAGNWKLRNSWGVTWGAAGYMWISGAKDCGVKLLPLYPNLL